MAHYTGHKFTLTELNTIEQQKSDFLNSLNIKLSAPDLLVKDLSLMLKSLEVMENLEHLPEYKDFLINVANRSATFVNPTEMIPNGGFDVTYNTTNLVTNSSFSADAFELEIIKNSGFDVPVDLARPWANGIAYKFDTLFTEGTQIVQAFTDGQQTALTWFETELKPNTQYKFSYDLTVNPVNWDLLSGGFNMVDIPSSDKAVFSETGGGPDPQTFICSVIEDASLVRPTCDGVAIEWNTSIEQMAIDCQSGGGVWDEGAINDPLAQNHILIPYHINAREGDTIIFTNPSTSILVHNAVSDDNIAFISPDLNPGESWSWVVDGYHDLYFHCTFHPLEEGRLTSTTNHRYVYAIDHGLNPGDTVKIPINYGANVALPSLSNSYAINLALPQSCTSLGGAGDQNVVESLYHDLSIGNIVSFQSGEVETNPDAGVPVDVVFQGGTGSDTANASASVQVTGGVVSDISLTSGGSGYIEIPTVYIVGGGGAGATASINFSGNITSISIDDIGSGYQTAPTVQISAPDVATIPDGIGGTIPTTPATAIATINASGSIDSITITENGSGYHSPPTITLVGGTPTVAGSVSGEINGSVLGITLISGGSGYGSGDGSVGVGERKWEEYIITAVQKGDARVDIFFDDVNVIGHLHTAELTPAEYQQIKNGTPTVIMTSTDGEGSGENSPHSHSATFDWDPALNNGDGGMYLVGMTGSHTHGMQNYYDITGGTKVELTNFGHYHEILISLDDEATLKAAPLQNVTQDTDGTWSATSGNTLILTSDYGTSDPQHFHTLEMGCLDPDNDTYLIIAIDQHIHDFDRVWYPGSSQFTLGQYNFALGGDDTNPTSINLPFIDIIGYVKKDKGIECDAHGLKAGDKVHYQNVYNGIHHGNTNYFVDYVIDWDHFVLTESVIYPLGNAPGTTPTQFDVVESYEVVADLASYRFEVERDLTNHVGSPFIEGVEIHWSRPRTVKSTNHGLSVGDVVQLPSGPQPYTPSELPGAMNDHTVVALGDGYGPTDNMEITVDTQTTLTFVDPDTTTVEGAQDSPWYWTWWDHSDPSYAPYQVDEAVAASFGGNEGTTGGFDLYRGGTYKFTNNAWNPSGHIVQPDPFTGLPTPMYMHAAGVKAILGAGWDNLVEAGMVQNDGKKCVSMRADHGLTIVAGDHNPFNNLEEEPGNWTSTETFPVCMGLNGWCEELDVDGWYYNGEDDKQTCLDLNPTSEVGLAQWRESQYIGNFSKEFTWKIPEDFGLTGSDGNSGLGPFVAPGEVNGYYAVEADGGLYKFDKEGMIEGTNRTVNLYRGGTYRFRVNAAGHPMYITTDDGSHFTPGAYFGEYLLGVNGSRAEEGAGDQTYADSSNFGLDGAGVPKYEILEFTVPSVAPDTLYYQCAWHASMMGQFNIIDLPVVNAGEDIVVYYHHGQDNMYTPLHIKDKIVVDNGTSTDYFQVQPEPVNSFPVKGTQADVLNEGNLLTATGEGAIPKIQAMNIELGTTSYIDPLVMIPGIGSEQFLVTNNESGLAKVYISVDIDKRSNISLDNVTFKEVVWTESGSWQIQGGTAFTNTTVAGYIEQIVTGSIVEGTTYEIQYDIVESFKDDFDAEVGTVQAVLIGDTIVEGTSNTTVGHYSETVIAPANTNILRLNNTGKGKIDNVSIRERVTGQNAWYMGEGWNSVGGKAYIDGTISSKTEVNQTVDIETGKLYEVKYNLADLDPNDNGMSGRLRVTLGTNPENLISNWNFDFTDPVLVNWTTSGPDVQIVNEKLIFNSSTNGTATYTLANALVKNEKYEATIDCDVFDENILNFQVGPGPAGTHAHTFQMTETQSNWLQENPSVNTLSFVQTDGYHAETYTHIFTIAWSQDIMSYVLVSQTIPEGHDELTLVSTTNNNPTIDVFVDGVAQHTISTTGIHHIDLVGEASSTFMLQMNGSGSINSVKLVEEEIPAIDYDSTGVVPNGEQSYYTRAGSHDSKIHFIADVDNNRPEENNPYYTNIGFEGSIDNISVREVEENWTFASQEGGNSYVDQTSQQIYTSGVGTGARGIAHISFEITNEMNYRVGFNIDRPTDSIVKIGPTPDSDTYGSFEITANDNDGDKDFIFTAPVTGVAYITLSTTGNGFTYWDNVSVKTIPNLSSDEYLLLARSLNVFGVPIGGEERWKSVHLDMENADYTGQPISGMRTLESFGESVIENYYDVNRRSNDILNPPVSLTGMNIEFGTRAVTAINPSCSNDLYNNQVDCETPNGTWFDTVVSFCSDSIYPDEVSCIEPNGTWTAGSCSNPIYGDVSSCEDAGTCSDSQFNNSETQCTTSGGVWTSDNNTWTFGVCTDISFTDQSSCESPRGVWTPENPAHCTDLSFNDQSSCESPRGVWDATVVEAMTGDTIEVTGAGIDPNYIITIGGVEQSSSPINLPTKVNFILNADTPLGIQEFKITNIDGDFAILDVPFTVLDHLRIITVTDNLDGTYGVTGASFESTTTVTLIDQATTTDYPQTVTFVDANNISFTDVVNPGTYDVRVDNSDGSTFTEIDAVVIA